MRPTARGFKDVVIFATITPGPDSSGDSGARPASAGTTLRCSFQAESEARVVVHSQVESLVIGSLIFRSFPVDTSTGARPPGTCRVEDEFSLQPRSDDPPMTPARTLVAAGPARRSAGQDKTWVVDVKERQ